jgi:Rps23 Pro-64 3,4-dihydroxylase Tpa1-like proline 4-hydroxylase
MVTINPIYNNYMWINHFNTLVSYYENSDYYKPHSDVAVYSTLTYLYKDPKNFTGGDISFIIENERLDIEIQNNLSIVFPSGYLHEVSPVTILNSGLEDHGRYCISLFAFIT